MSEVFGPTYAGAYDPLYGDKDYEAECDLVERIFARLGGGAVRSVLDLGAGTGGHAVPLAARGYEVVGVERSPQMLAQAKRKARGSVEFHEGDIRTVDLEREFDATLMMFAVLGYQLGDEDVLAALATARRHLRPGGLLLFDVWYGPAVLRQGPSDRAKTVKTQGGRIERTTTGELEVAAAVCTVTYAVRRYEGESLVEEAEERHRMRFFFPEELGRMLAAADLALLDLRAFPNVERVPDESTWNVLAVALRR